MFINWGGLSNAFWTMFTNKANCFTGNSSIMQGYHQTTLQHSVRQSIIQYCSLTWRAGSGGPLETQSESCNSSGTNIYHDVIVCVVTRGWESSLCPQPAVKQLCTVCSTCTLPVGLWEPGPGQVGIPWSAPTQIRGGQVCFVHAINVQLSLVPRVCHTRHFERKLSDVVLPLVPSPRSLHFLAFLHLCLTVQTVMHELLQSLDLLVVEDLEERMVQNQGLFPGDC